MVSGSIKKRFSIDCVNIHLSQLIAFANSYLFSIFYPVKKRGVTPHCLCCDSLTLKKDKKTAKIKQINKQKMSGTTTMAIITAGSCYYFMYTLE